MGGSRDRRIALGLKRPRHLVVGQGGVEQSRHFQWTRQAFVVNPMLRIKRMPDLQDLVLFEGKLFEMTLAAGIGPFLKQAGVAGELLAGRHPGLYVPSG